MSKDLLPIALSAAVPLYIEEFKIKGCPTEEDYKNLSNVAQLLGEHGDLLLFGSPASKKGYKGKKKDKITTADIFNKVARSVAIMSFCPGGITLFGQHYETKEEK